MTIRFMNISAKTFLNIGLLIMTGLTSIGLLCLFIICPMINDWTYMYGFLVCLPINYLTLYLFYKIPNMTLNMIGKKKPKSLVVVSTGIFAMMKTILIVLPLLVFQAINLYALNGYLLFSPITMLVAIGIYVLAIISAKFVLLYKNRKIEKAEKLKNGFISYKVTG